MKRLLTVLFPLAVLASFSLLSSVDAATVCQIFTGCTGTSTAPAYGQVLIGGKNGEYEFVASSTLGTGGGGSNWATTSSDYWLSQRSTSNLPEDSNLYYTAARDTANFISNLAATTSVASITTLANLSLPATQLTSFGVPFYTYLHATTTDALSEGLSNLYFTTARATSNFVSNLAATTSVKSITTLPSLSLPYSQLTGTPTIASSTLLGDSNTFSGSNTFTSTITGSVSGNAGTATKLQNTRTINGVSFDGTANIVVASTTLLGDKNAWSALQSFSYASTTGLSASYASSTVAAFGNASTTLLSTSYASSTAYQGAGLATCTGSTNFLQWSGGFFSCGAVSSSGITTLGTGYASTTLTEITFSTTTATTNGQTFGIAITATNGALTFTPTVTGTYTGPAGLVANALTINNGGSGAASGATYNGSSAVTLSYNSIGAVPTSRNINTTFPLQGGGALSADLTLSSAFGTTTNTGLTPDQFVYTNHTGVFVTAASSSLNLPNAALANSTISGIALGGTLNSLSHNASLSGTSYNGSAAISDWGLNLGNANTWTALQTFGNASSTLFSSSYASSTNFSAGTANISSLTLGSLSGFLRATAGTVSTSLISLTSDITGILGVANGGTGTSTAPTYGKLLVGNAAGGYDYMATSTLGLPTFADLSSFSTSGYPFALSGNATSTLTQFNGGLTAFASSTIGNGSATGGLTINGGATTTGTVAFTGLGSAGLLYANAGGAVSAVSTSTWSFASSTILSDSNTFSGTNTFVNPISGSVTGNAGTVTNGVYTTTFNSLFAGQLAGTTTDALAEGSSNLYWTTARGIASFVSNLAATTSVASITTLPNLSLPSSQVTGLFSYLFPNNATTTGLGLYASTTIGNGTKTGGLTVSGTATTSNLITTYASTSVLTINGPYTQNLFMTSPGWATLLTLDTDGRVSGGVLQQTCTNKFIRTMSINYIATCAAVSLTADVSGILPIANGGTNSTSFTTNSLMWYDGTSIVSTSTAPLYVGSLVASSTIATSTFLGGINLKGTIQLSAAQPATSTAIVLDWASSKPQIEYRIGTSATTITLINATTSTQWGSRKLVWVCNPGSTAGGLTWAGVEWIGSTPTQTTTANQCDVYSFDVTLATSSSAYKIAGTAGTGFQ